MRKVNTSVLFFLFLLGGGNILAQNQLLIIDEEHQKVKVVSHQWKYDSTALLGPKDIIQSKTVMKNEHSLEDFEGNYWLSLKIQNTSREPQNFLLEAVNWEEAELFSIENDREELLSQTSKLLPLQERPLPYSRLLLPLKIKARDSVQLLLRLHSTIQYLQAERAQVRLLSKEKFVEKNSQRLLYQGIYWGILLVMAVYNFLIYLVVKNRTYLYYLLSILGLGLYFQFYYGFTLEYYWPDKPLFDTFIFMLIVPLTNIARALFTQSFLQTKKYLKFWHQALNGIIILYSLPLAMALITYANWFDLSGHAVWIIGVLGNVLLFLMVLVGLLALKKSFKLALIFLSANLFFVIGASLFILQELNWIVPSPLSIYAIQVGTLLQVVLFSLGLGYQLNKAREELMEERLDREKRRREREIQGKELLAKQKEILETQVSQRTLALNTKSEELRHTILQLKDSEADLKKMNQIKDKLFSVISHDLRSPLATLNSFVNILVKRRDSLSPEKLQILANKTNESIQNLSLLLDNLLQWSRAQMKAPNIKMESFSLQPLIERNIELFRFQAENKGIAMEAQVGQQVVRADRNMLDFVIRNLIHNALKFTPKNGTVKISTKKDGSRLWIKIKDSGTGINPEMLKDLTLNMGSISLLGTDKETGTGLGLMICKEFVEKMDGGLLIESQEGKGSCFSIGLTIENSPSSIEKGKIMNVFTGLNSKK